MVDSNERGHPAARPIPSLLSGVKAPRPLQSPNAHTPSTYVGVGTFFAQRPVLSAAQRWRIAGRRAASTLHATDWLALPYWARSSIGWDGRLALRASRSP
jgi:hypothetical protein